jgi:hypothetical protein
MNPPARELDESVFSNIDHELDDNLVGELEKGDCFARHAAWNFNGSIWFDVGTGTWYEDVWVYQMKVEQFTGDTIMGVIEQANAEYGSG